MFSVRFSPRAQRDLRGLPAQVVQRVLPRIDELAEDPRPQGAKKLSGEKDIWRIRVGDYRVLYAIDDGIRVVEVRKVGHRKDIYD
jgi:mRNA interferase RelE/StbE